MRRFTQLYVEMDRTKRTSEKVAAMERYFRETPPQDAAWALYFLAGRKLKRLITWRILDDAIRRVTNLPSWLISESYESVGDSAELMALLFPDSHDHSTSMPLQEVVAQRMLPLRTIAEPSNQAALIIRTWREMDTNQRLVFNKLITGNFRVGVAQTLITRALASVAQVPAAVMAHRFAGAWEPTAESFEQLLRGGDQSAADRSQPYPFYLAYQLERPADELGDLQEWQLEWKYDGLRAQLIRRDDATLIWSRGDELITASFPEIAQAASDLPANTVLDGEIAAWENDHPLPFNLLQRRINRKAVEATLWTDVPVAFVAFDVLEHDGVDLREKPLGERRAILESIIASLSPNSHLRIAPLLSASNWNNVGDLRLQSREKFVEGVMLKRLSSPYGVGRKRGDWWKWKIDPYTVDAVLIYAQGGSGRRSGLFTDYTFGVWDSSNGQRPPELVPVAKAYSGLTDEEIRQVDRFIRRNTLEKRGPVRIVKPELVFELAFEAIQESDRHKAGLAIRFPRMNRWRTDKKADDADTLEMLRHLLQASRGEAR
jgi:DNA ligase 1